MQIITRKKGNKKSLALVLLKSITTMWLISKKLTVLSFKNRPQKSKGRLSSGKTQEDSHG